MKRMNKTAIALVTAGALGLGIAPMADAQPAGDADWGLLDQNNNEANVQANRPGASEPLPSGLQEQPGPTHNGDEKRGDDLIGTLDENPYPSPSAPLPSGLQEQPGPTHNGGEKRGDDLIGTLDENPYPGASDPLPTGLSERPLNPDELIKNPKNENEYLFEDVNGAQFYLPVDEHFRPLRNGEVVEGLRPANSVNKPGETTEKDALPVVLGVLGGLAGLGLVIAGVNYWVNKDGNLVTDPNKVNEPSNPADAEKTKEIVGKNLKEVADQVGVDPVTGQPVDGQRGIGASTGVNQIPAALLSLLLASVLGAAAFVFGRRQLI